jgi:hypothetical protein
VTWNHALAVDTVVIGGGVSEFRPLPLPNGASVNGVAAPPRASSVPFRAPAVAAPAAPIRNVGEKACDTANASGDRGPASRHGNGNGVHGLVITPDFTGVTLHVVESPPGDSVPLNSPSRLCVEAMPVPASAGARVMLVGLAAVMPLRRRG